VLSYRIKNQKVQILLFHFLPIVRIKCNRIIRIRKVSKGYLLKYHSFSRLAFSTLSAGNRLFGTAVLIQKTGGWLEYVVITPDNPDAFVAQVQREGGNVEPALWAGGSFVTRYPGTPGTGIV
jgi:hypothetical protein